MGIYFRPERGTWWLKIPTGKAEPPYLYRETAFTKDEEPRAQAVYDQVLLELGHGRRWDHLLTPDITVAAYGRGWCDDRQGRVAGARDERTHLEMHVYPVLGKMPLADVRPRNVELLVETLKKKLRAPRRGPEARGEKPVTEMLSGKYIKHIIGTLHRMFERAVFDELVVANPVKVRREVLPKKKDRGIRRSEAVFAREEIEAVISDERIPLDRRTIYALLFLTGMRPQELVVLRWRDYDPEAEPLGRLYIERAWSRNLKVEKETKTDEPREVPVHATLAKVLATWRLSGFVRYFGRAPGLDDYVVPSRLENRRGLHHLYDRLLEDLARVGLRRRRLYDSRRTFISLGLAAGATKDQLRWITHGVRRDVLDDYTTLPWPTLCGLVSPIKIKLREGRVHQLRRAAVGAPLPAELPRTEPRAVTKSVTSEDLGVKNILISSGYAMGPAGLEPVKPTGKDAASPDEIASGRRAAPRALEAARRSSGVDAGALVTLGNPPELSPGCERCRAMHVDFEAVMLDGDLRTAARHLRALVEHCAAEHAAGRAG